MEANTVQKEPDYRLSPFPILVKCKYIPDLFLYDVFDIIC